MIEFTLSILGNVGIILFFLASLLVAFSTLSYVVRTEDYLALFLTGGLNKWNDLNPKEKSYYKRALRLGVMSLVLTLVGNSTFLFL